MSDELRDKVAQAIDREFGFGALIASDRAADAVLDIHEIRDALEARAALAAAQAREAKLREAANPFLPGARPWGRMLAWMVAGSEACGAKREEGIAAAAEVNRWRAALDAALASPAPEVKP